VAAACSVHPPGPAGDAEQAVRLAALRVFRHRLYDCLGCRADALFELCDALAGGQLVASLAALSLAPSYRRGWGSAYQALAVGGLDADRLKDVLAGLPMGTGRPIYAVDTTTWPRPYAATSPGRRWHYHPSRHTNRKPIVAAWVWQWVCRLDLDADSWTQPVDLRLLGADEYAVTVAATQVRQLCRRLGGGQGRPLVCLDQGYDLSRLTVDLAEIDVEVLVRVRGDRCFYFDPPPRPQRARGRPRRHGHKLACNDPATWPTPTATHTEQTQRYGQVRVLAWQGVHPRQRCPGRWPTVRGTLLRVQVQRTPTAARKRAVPKVLWLWRAGPDNRMDLGLLWRAYLRRFDIEHTIGFVKQQLGWTIPRLRTPAQADRWGWLVIGAYTQLRLARGLTGDARLPWQPPQLPSRATPARVRQGFPRLFGVLSTPASAPKPSGRAPGRPKGHHSTPAPRYRVAKRTGA
jgi:hypothetical protein